MRKNIVTTVLALLLVTSVAWAATTDFVANGDITVSSVTMGSVSVNLFIFSGSKAASMSYDGGVFSVVDPDATAGFKVGSSNSTVKTFKVTKSGGEGSACAENITPGTSYISLSTTADTYTITPSTYSACTDHCTSVTNAATYNAYPTCGAATCKSGYALSGSGSTATCRSTEGGGVVGGGGGGGYSGLGLTTTPSPSPSATPSVSPSPTPAPTVAGIKDGDLVKTADSPKVYIVNGIYKRWIMNPKIFNLYGHFKWNAIKIVSASDLAKYTDSWLIRADKDPKVYELNGDLTKHWLNMTAQKFNESGRKWGMVFIINSAEIKLYKTGVEVQK